MSALTDFKSYSQAGQDRFVYELLGPDFVGRFLDVGCSHPVTNNNTYALEKAGWVGMMVDVDNVVELCKQYRSCKFCHADATKMVFQDAAQFDYGSFDIDNATYDALQNALNQGARFRVLTVEHDSYRIGTEMRDKIRKLLGLAGYTMICEDVCHEGHPFEDWWVDYERVDKRRAMCAACAMREGKEIRSVCSDINHHFNKAFVINRLMRHDRWVHAQEELWKLGLAAERFEAHDGIQYEGALNGNAGCTASHRALLEIIAYKKWNRTLVLEDDFVALYDDVPERLDAMLPEVPSDMDILYLGGHYGEAPLARVSPHVIRCAGMLTTSSYVITWQAARRMAPYISGIGPIDNLFSMFARTQKHYILQPRLFAQYTSKSDLCGETRDNVPCMTDTRHENMV